MTSTSDAVVEKSCQNCGNRCMDMDLDPYCSASPMYYGMQHVTQQLNYMPKSTLGLLSIRLTLSSK